jgi:hypothetical protein
MIGVTTSGQIVDNDARRASAMDLTIRVWQDGDVTSNIELQAYQGRANVPDSLLLPAELMELNSREDWPSLFDTKAAWEAILGGE